MSTTSGWRLLLGLALRRDRVLAGVWIGVNVDTVCSIDQQYQP